MDQNDKFDCDLKKQGLFISFEEENEVTEDTFEQLLSEVDEENDSEI